MYCTSCGAKLSEGARFCTSCGARVGAASVDAGAPAGADGAPGGAEPDYTVEQAETPPAQSWQGDTGAPADGARPAGLGARILQFRRTALAAVPAWAFVLLALLLAAGTAYAAYKAVTVWVLPALEQEEEVEEAKEVEETPASDEQEEEEEEEEAEEEAVDIDALLTDYATDASAYLSGNSYTAYLQVGTYDISAVPELPLTWLVDDFDGDGQSELLVIDTQAGESTHAWVTASYNAVLTMYEVDAEGGEPVVAAEYTVDCGVVGAGDTANLLWGTYEQDGVMYIAFECWEYTNFFGDGVVWDFIALNYGDGAFELAASASFEGSFFEEGELDTIINQSLAALNVSVDGDEIASHEETVLEDYLGAIVFCTSTTTLVMDSVELTSLYYDLDSAESIEGTIITFTDLHE